MKAKVEQDRSGRGGREGRDPGALDSELHARLVGRRDAHLEEVELLGSTQVDQEIGRRTG